MFSVPSKVTNQILTKLKRLKGNTRESFLNVHDGQVDLSVLICWISGVHIICLTSCFQNLDITEVRHILLITVKM